MLFHLAVYIGLHVGATLYKHKHERNIGSEAADMTEEKKQVR